MSLVLSLETSTEACSVALCGESVEHELFEVAARQHSQRLLPMIEQLLAETGTARSQIDAVAFGRGPGAFTGVRIATASAQGLGWALDRPVIAVSTLAALAQQGLRRHGAERILAALDARMHEIYWGVWQCHEGSLRAMTEETVCPPQAVATQLPPQWPADSLGIGSGWLYKADIPIVVASTDTAAYPRAIDVATLAIPLHAEGLGLPAEQGAPVYLRHSVTHAVVNPPLSKCTE